MKILIAAAGTGGHINPGIAIAGKIKKENPRAEITFVGTTRGLENDLVPRAGYPLKTIEVYGISREISVANVKKMCKTLRSFGQARKLIKELNPDLVIGTGGYICGPIFLAATKKNIPTILHESNAFPGVTVKMLAKKVDKILVGFEDAKKRLSKAKNVIVTGTPTKFKNLNLREEQKDIIKTELGFKTNLPIVLVFGGSQGARSINEAILAIIKEKKNTNYQIMWAPGPKQYDGMKEKLEEVKINALHMVGVKMVPYIYHMEEMLSVSDLVVCRSGAMTITEMAIIGKPAIFVPLPFAAENHQEYNANVLVDKNAANILRDKDLTGESLDKMIGEMIQDPTKLKQMGENAKQIDRKKVEDSIYAELKEFMK